MTDKGVTIERSPSGLGMGVFSPHLGGGGGSTWEQQQSTIITKLAQTPSSTRINLPDNNFDKERRNRRTDEKNNVNRSCGCGGWARVVQLEHDLAELTVTHQNLLAGLHLQVDTLKQKNRDLTFQLLMGPTASQVKPEFPFSPESDEATSPKKNKLRGNTAATAAPKNDALTTTTTTIGTNTTSNTTASTTTNNDTTVKVPLSLQSPPGGLTNGDIVIRRSLKGRSGRGDPRLVRSLDLELLEEEAHHTRRLLEEERAKNKYLTTLIEDLKKYDTFCRLHLKRHLFTKWLQELY
ncbi:putative Coiled-coil domain of unknown function-containing protein [Homarus americanus]|uniref:CCDC92/74 N-terminal domain-containing protein n=1 Tax=Homarus americanus TaxID=6706 RepID=A0A8J5MK78_HOMAM|nr:putative Coiled-coil domain of unknown function-containing protein [Homarus americanus]